MEPAIIESVSGLVVGIVATIVVSRYYFLRSIDKELGIYRLLDSTVFSGTADAKEHFNLLFHDRPVTELQQLIFLVANTGERSISDVIEPLALALPSGAEILNASVVYRSHKGLAAHITHEPMDRGGTRVRVAFPLLNKDEFIVIKLLLSGHIDSTKINATIMADDLPRSLKPWPLSLGVVRDPGFKIDWREAMKVLLFTCAVVAFLSYMMFNLWEQKPPLIPHFWSAVVLSPESLAMCIVISIVILFTIIIGLFFLFVILFDGVSPLHLGPRFQLPKEIRGMAYPFHRFEFDEEFIE